MAPAEDPPLDVHALFCHYNSLYFHDSLGACAVSWTAARLPSGPSTCHCYPGGGCEILLSKPLLQCLSAADVKNVLLHEMIHAYMCINHDNTNHSDHGRSFQLMMNSINTSMVADHQRPVGGYNITAHHSPRNEVYSHCPRNEVYSYKCETCGDFSQHGNCIEKVGPEAFCDNASCHWHRHKKLCSGVFIKVQEPSRSKENTSLRADETLHEDKPTELPHITKRTTKNLRKGGGTDDKHEMKKDSLANSARSAGDAAGTPSNISTRDNSGKKAIEPEAIDTKTPRLRNAKEIPKRARKNNSSARLKRRKLSKRENEYTVIIGWLEVYGDEETDEDGEPLINKRAERRKQQRMLKNMQETKDDSISNIISRRKEDAYAGSNISSPGKNHKTRPGSTAEISSVGSAVKADTCSAPRTADGQGSRLNVYDPEGSSEGSPSSSPIRVDIVDISDG